MFSMARIITTELLNLGIPVSSVAYTWDSDRLDLTFEESATEQQIIDGNATAQTLIANRDALKAAWQP